jgi:hypothetical protein
MSYPNDHHAPVGTVRDIVCGHACNPPYGFSSLPEAAGPFAAGWVEP